MANQPKKYKKFVATAATATLVASAIVPVASAASFSDTAGNTHEAAISALAEAGVISGYPDGTFKPNKELTRSDVVKLLGKFLVTQGYEIPSDAVSSPRFSDLTSKSNKELLEYAAVVADAGVFAGSNGKLLAGDPITRENMAIVLVRMVNTLKDVSLEDYVNGQNFTKEVKDLNVAKAEARSAINVLDFYDITTATNFLPKNTVTRGQFATFLNNVIKADFSGASATTGTVKAINATTVEVTFADTVDNINALKFTIDGLEVKNAAVKQTDKKTVVLTTSAQTAGVEYTVKESGNEIGKFTGISAVIPTSINVVEKSLQGVLGQQVTVKAQVTVAEGQSKAGIPVTFNVTGTGSLNAAQLFEANTDENGVATYTYTRYASTTDEVVAYATGDRTKFSAGKIYWETAHQLTVKDITTDTTLVNGAKKVYEINSAKNANKYVFVAFEENLNKTPDKLTKSVLVEGLTTFAVNTDNTVGAGLTTGYPYEITTGAKAVTAVKLDASGKANLVLTGANGKVTPIVYEAPHVTNVTNPGTLLSHYTNVVYNPTALQAKASTATFELKHTLGLTIQAAGVANAATYKGSVQTGGRDYTITYTDKDGKPAAAGNSVYVAIPTSSKAEILDSKGNYRTDYTVSDGNRYYPVSITGTKGQAKFTVAATDITTHVAPIVFVNNGTVPATTFLDASDLQAQGESTYFVEAITYGAKLSVLDKNDDDTTSVLAGGGEFAKFVYSLVDQNGKPRAFSTSDTNVSFQVTAGTGVLTVAGNLGTTTVSQGNPKTITAVIPAGQLEAEIIVSSVDPSAATVTAIGSRAGVVLPTTDPTSVSVSFTKFSTVVTKGLVANVNKTANTLTIEGVPYNYTNAAFAYNGSSINIGQFETTYLADGVTISVTKDAEGLLTFNIVTDAATTTGSWESARLAITSAVTLAEVKAQLAKLPEFTTLIKADQDAIATDIWTNHVSGGTPFATAAAFKADYDALLVDPLKTVEAAKVLKAAIATAQAKHDGATEGTAIGQYTAGSKAAFQAKITAAKAILDGIVDGTTATSGTTFETNLTAAKTTLETTDTTAFENAKITDARVELGKSITQAKALVAAAQEGTAPGEYAIGSVATLQGLITTAEGHYAASYTSNSILVAQKGLVDAGITALQAKEIKAVAVTTDVTGLVLTFSPALEAAVSSVVSSNAGLTVAATASTTAGVTITVSGTPAANDTITLTATVTNALQADGTTQENLTFDLKYDGTKWVLVPNANFVAPVAP